MAVRDLAKDSPWLMLTFTLPVKRASQRVEIWRLLQRYGAVPLGNSGYLLPNTPVNQERFEWLGAAVRKYSGEASVVRVNSIDNLTIPQLAMRFNQARQKEYQALLEDLRQVSSSSTRKGVDGRLSRLRARFREIAEVDFFSSPMRKRVEDMLARAAESPVPVATVPSANPRHYVRRIWVTRPRPGIDRSASAWLIRRFIDKRARFAFAPEGATPPDAVPFDMFHSGGFGHRGEDCTFETLQKEFRIRDAKVTAIGEMIHDADILDEKFGRKEAFGIDAVLSGWAHDQVSDVELLTRGIQLIEALYRAISRK